VVFGNDSISIGGVGLEIGQAAGGELVDDHPGEEVMGRLSGDRSPAGANGPGGRGGRRAPGGTTRAGGGGSAVPETFEVFERQAESRGPDEY